MSQDMVRHDDFGRDHGLVHEAIITGRKVGAGRSFWKGLAHDEEFFREVMQLAEKHGHADLVAGIFIPPAAQLDLARQRNNERNWGSSDADFEALGEPPEWPEGNFSAVVLEVSLDTVQRTFEEAWHFAATAQPDRWLWDRIKSDPDGLRLLPGIAHKRGLRWRVINLASNWDRKYGIRPADVRNPETSPHSAILWAASYFPKWVQAMDGSTVPYVWIPGYQVTIAGYNQWSGVPDLSWSRVDRRVGLLALEDREHKSSWAVPAFRE